MPTITPFLWFDNNAEEAFTHYTNIFVHAKILRIDRSADGSFFTGTIDIEGQVLHVMNGGPHYKLTPAFSLVIDCKDQHEVDYYWNALTSNGGQESRCGWCVDKFGVSWQVIPALLGKLMSDPDRTKANRAIQAMLKMNKIECDVMQKAFDGN